MRSHNLRYSCSHDRYYSTIVVFSSKINELSYFIYGITSLLFPFHYSFQISSSIPHNTFTAVESISPYLFGINQIFKNTFFRENKIDMSDLNVLAIDLDKLNDQYFGGKIIPDIP